MPQIMLERLGAECGDLQFLRELTVNGLEAIAARPHPVRGRVVWDLDSQRFDASAGKVRELTVTDTGTGMRPDQLGRYINELASSSREQSHTANFGVGAKVAAGSRNPHGLEYRSWHQGHGALVRFKRHRDGRWGLEPQRWPDGHHDCWRPLGEQDKPWLLCGQDHAVPISEALLFRLLCWCDRLDLSAGVGQRRSVAQSVAQGPSLRPSAQHPCGILKAWPLSRHVPHPRTVSP